MATPNLLNAMLNMSKATNKLSKMKRYNNRITQAGVALEIYVKNSFCGVPDKLAGNIDILHDKIFSYAGNLNHPPDAMLKGGNKGDAIEIKKLESLDASTIALNSSYPKARLYSDSTLLTKACKECEPGWKVRDMIYAVGYANGSILNAIDFVYGDCYAADREVYESIASRVKAGIAGEGLEFSETKELGRINRADPLGRTYLRLRGMWGILTPAKAFKEKIGESRTGKFTITALMKASKYLSFPKEDRLEIERVFKVSDIKIRNPNGAGLLNAKFIVYNRV